MQQNIINTQDLEFQLFELHQVEDFLQFDRYSDHSRETLQAALDLALKVAAEEFAPHARAVDEEEPTFENGQVVMRPEVKKALDVLKETGLLAATQDFERGGMQLPSAVGQMCVGLLKGANVGTQAYAGLTIAAANLILTQGSDEQRPLLRHHVPDRAPFGFFPGGSAHPGGASRRWQLPPQGQQDFHFRRRP